MNTKIIGDKVLFLPLNSEMYVYRDYYAFNQIYLEYKHRGTDNQSNFLGGQIMCMNQKTKTKQPCEIAS